MFLIASMQRKKPSGSAIPDEDLQSMIGIWKHFIRGIASLTNN